MKIAYDISPLNPAKSKHSVRGVGFYTNNLKNALIKHFPDNEYIFFEDRKNIPSSVDILHIPYFDPFFLSLPLVKKHKTIVTVHDLIPFLFPMHFPSGLRGQAVWHLQKSLLKSVDAIITDSEASKSDITRIVGIKREKIHVTHLAADAVYEKLKLTEKDKQYIRDKYFLPKVFLLYVGDVTWNKNLPRIIQASLKADMPIVMVGKALAEKNFDKDSIWNKDRITIERVAEENKNIIRLGFLPQEDLIKLYNMADIFLFPSLYEGFGLPVLEAMACGVPVITSKEGSLAEVGKDAAYYVDAYSSENISEGIKTIMSDSHLRQQLIEKGIKHTKEFTWKKTAQETMKVYEKAH